MSEQKYNDEFFEQYTKNYIPAPKENERREEPPKEVPKKSSKKRKNKFFLAFIAVCLVCAVAAGTVYVLSLFDKVDINPNGSGSEANAPVESVPEVELFEIFTTEKTKTFTTEIKSEYAVLIDAKTGEVVAQKAADTVIYPASMTKVLTLLTAVEIITDLNDTYTVKYDDIHPGYVEGASMAGFAENEVVTIKDLLYGTVLPSGADATACLASYLAGSETEFAPYMNAKAKQLGIKNANFVNTSGLHNANHYCTVKDIAVIMKAAMENPICKEILSTYQYTTSITPEHPEGIVLTSTLFSRMYGTEPEVATITAGKTGFTNEAGNCIVSYGVSQTGNEYIFVTAKAAGAWPSVFDHINTYKTFTQ